MGFCADFGKEEFLVQEVRTAGKFTVVNYGCHDMFYQKEQAAASAARTIDLFSSVREKVCDSGKFSPDRWDDLCSAILLCDEFHFRFGQLIMTVK
jgi:hypothetical protein